MPRYEGHWKRPGTRVYEYNHGIMSNYYRPMTRYLETSDRLGLKDTTPTPGPQSYAERTVLVSPPQKTVPSEESSSIVPLWKKHPYRLPVEDEHVAPHESSVWPESVPHFNLVSSYDLMIGYLGLKQPKA